MLLYDQAEIPLKRCNLSEAFSVLHAKSKRRNAPMEERTRVLICVGAATAANCIPCVEYYFGKAKTVGLLTEEIQEAVDLASQVKKGAHMAIKNCINGLMGEEREYALPCDRQASKSCCG
jgi:alkylhydroperoxidase/carboxymuconolactone decarboxylase family protein YurZ